MCLCNPFACITVSYTHTGVGPDRVKFNSTVRFTPDGPKEQTVSAMISNDDIALEDNEEVNVTLNVLSPSSGVMLGDFPTTLVTIVNDDCKFSIVRKVSSFKEWFKMCFCLVA